MFRVDGPQWKAGNKWIAYALPDNGYNYNYWSWLEGWCSHEGAELHIGDFNGDQNDDMLCHDTNTGYKWVAEADSNGMFSGTSWYDDCLNQLNIELYIELLYLNYKIYFYDTIYTCNILN